ncbi:MAG: M15 family peptidase [bacterium]|nr:M15 family peptidase [bacterium]
MTLREARCEFTKMLAWLILWACEQGYEPALAEGMDRRTEKDPTSDHMKNSLHDIGLAQDIDLYRDGKYLSNTEDHLPLGEKWESMGGAWGGRFKDGNHYSLAWAGKK